MSIHPGRRTAPRVTTPPTGERPGTTELKPTDTTETQSGGRTRRSVVKAGGAAVVVGGLAAGAVGRQRLWNFLTGGGNEAAQGGEVTKAALGERINPAIIDMSGRVMVAYAHSQEYTGQRPPASFFSRVLSPGSGTVTFSGSVLRLDGTSSFLTVVMGMHPDRPEPDPSDPRYVSILQQTSSQSGTPSTARAVTLSTDSGRIQGPDAVTGHGTGWFAGYSDGPITNDTIRYIDTDINSDQLGVTDRAIILGQRMLPDVLDAIVPPIIQ